MSGLSNTIAVTRREYLVRARTRSFILGTALLVIAVVAVALAPIGIRYIDQTGTQTLSVWVAPGVDPGLATTLKGILNAPSTGVPVDPNAKPDFTVTSATDLATARQQAIDGQVNAALGIERASDGELQFTLYTDDPTTSPTSRLVGQQATTALAIADRLERLGVDPASQVGLFAPSRFALSWADPADEGPAPDSAQQGADYLLGFGLTILIFMLIVLYGNWIAMSVVEEKSSRVMEVILNAATPFQLLSGKVLGVGAVALTQYAAILLAGVAALVLQGPLATTILGDSGGEPALPAGLTIGMLLLLGVFGVLGFLLYGVLYAAAGSLVSRQEDVQAAVMPLAVISTLGYIVAVYAATGVLDITEGWIVLLAVVPFVSPFLMLSRVSSGEATMPEVLLAIVLLVAAIAVAMWLAARIYAAGVLLYGQRPGLRSILRMARTGM
jgi:ABC-2 type transport system permease protein